MNEYFDRVSAKIRPTAVKIAFGRPPLRSLGVRVDRWTTVNARSAGTARIVSEFCQVLVMMAAPAAVMLTLRHVNVRADRASSPGTDTRPAR